ncbi:hypothetical protein H4V99_001089 [Cryobacterium sp. CG_9.6]|nr:hypothetical protein [Cryobacterium sp. CG_9.6]
MDSAWLGVTDAGRSALVEHDYVRLFQRAAHCFRMLTIVLAIYDADFRAAAGDSLSRSSAHGSAPIGPVRHASPWLCSSHDDP